MVYAPKNRDARSLSQETGFLYAAYLKMKKIADEINEVCRILENAEPWYAPELRKTAHPRKAQGTCISKKSSVKSTSNE